MRTEAGQELGRQDEVRLAEIGVSRREAERQLGLLRAPPPPLRLDRPCTISDGILSQDTLTGLDRLDAWESAAAAGRLSKFVPASGVASRMLDAAQRTRQHGAVSRSQLQERRARGDQAAGETLELIDHANELPFAEALAAAPPLVGTQLTEIESAEEVSHLLDALLEPDGLGLRTLAKGLIPFHRYASGSRTAFDEHLMEGAALLADRQGVSRCHFTVPAAQQAAFETIASRFASRHQIALRVSFSIQEPATDTLALDGDGRLVRHPDGRLCMRPGGHGALLANLQRADVDVVVLKNIDNVVPEPRQDDVVLWQKRLVELLLRTERRSHRLQEMLEADGWDGVLEDAEAFCREQLHWSPGATSPEGRRAQLLHRLDRPIRVCGMVPSEGEPGGGPFWVADTEGEVSLQIVEWAQIDASEPSQAAVWQASTHFNPVVLAASLRDRCREPYRLSEFSDPAAVVVTEKHINGRSARVLEHPGLWNGGMARWNTIFVEIPLTTFAPVKTVLDLLRPEHRTPLN